jgi:hypothetical protein
MNFLLKTDVNKSLQLQLFYRSELVRFEFCPFCNALILFTILNGGQISEYNNSEPNIPYQM